MIISNFGIWHFDNLIFLDIENINFWIYMYVILVGQALVSCWTFFARNEEWAALGFKSCGEEEQHVFIFYIFNRIKSIKNIKMNVSELKVHTQLEDWGARWLSGRVSDSGARGPGFETYRRCVVSLSKTLYSPKVLVNYPGSDGSVPTWLKNCWPGR